MFPILSLQTSSSVKLGIYQPSKDTIPTFAILGQYHLMMCTVLVHNHHHGHNNTSLQRSFSTIARRNNTFLQHLCSTAESLHWTSYSDYYIWHGPHCHGSCLPSLDKARLKWYLSNVLCFMLDYALVSSTISAHPTFGLLVGLRSENHIGSIAIVAPATNVPHIRRPINWA